NFTSGQGLVLMKEVLYTISGKRLPVVFHIGARALTSHSLNVHAGHDDVMAVSDTGWGIFFARNAQEAGDLALIARRAAEDSVTPFLNVQDGFLTTHTIENVLLCEPEMMEKYIGPPTEKLTNFMDTKFPVMTGVVQNQDSYMKGKIAQRHYYDKVPASVQNAMNEFYRLTGRRYNMTEGYRLSDADYVLAGMGSYMETALAVVDYLRKQGVKAGALNVTCFRPFPGPEIVRALSHVKKFSVLERMDNPLAQSNPLTVEIKAAFADALAGASGYPKISAMPKIYSGSAGLGSRDVRPGDLIAIFENMQSEKPLEYFVVGITHPTALQMTVDPDIRPEHAFSMRGHSVGGYGSVTTNKILATIGGEVFGMHVQAYPKYGSEKKGLPTTYYLTLAKEKIRTHCELDVVEFVAVNDVNAFKHGNPLHGIQEGGMVFIQTDRTAQEEVWADLPVFAKNMIRERKIRVLALDTVKIAREVSTSLDLVQRMQGIVLLGIFLKSTPFKDRYGFSDADLFSAVEKAIHKYFGKRGDRVVADNMKAIQRGYYEVFEVSRNLIEAGGKIATGRGASNVRAN
ncbi:MAG: 2-oxoacid:acceptor oxidoreductase family protein, partial [Candidatus Omnitrophica bacterium]|nr:2-oxoacid:acceptor oxidoreductase family protein [Candidatus Omnitrophota bacterium]